jgi:hypothetical protein
MGMRRMMGGIASVCPECGAANRTRFCFCLVCGHDLGTARSHSSTRSPKSPTSAAAFEHVNPYAPPTTIDSPLYTFRIRSLLMLIAMIAVCLGVGHENLFLGILLAVAVAPALVYTAIVAARRSALGRPMAFIDKVRTFLAAIVGVVVIAVSGFIAFFATCFSIASANAANANPNFLVILFTTSGAAAVAAGAFVTYLLLTRKGRGKGIPGEP